MNSIAFRIRDRANFSERVVRIEIDGRDLIELLRDVEAPFAAAEGHPDIAGGYEGLPLSAVAPPSWHFLGAADPLYVSEGRVAVLTCGGCGEVGCWPFEVRITVSRDEVIWSDFVQPHRPSWHYDQLPNLRFARAKYEAALARLGRAAIAERDG